MDFKVCHHGLQGVPSWTSRYAIMDFKVCHHGLQGMPLWTSRYAIMDFKVCHYRFQGMPSWTTRFARRESFLQDSTCLNASLFLPISPHLLSGPVFYSVEIHSNVIMYERPLVSHLLPPHPEIERERYSLMQKLRQSYRELCYARESTPQMLTARER